MIPITLPGFYHLPPKCCHVSGRRANHLPQERINFKQIIKNKSSWAKISHYHVFAAFSVLFNNKHEPMFKNTRKHFDERFQTPFLHTDGSENIGTTFPVTVLGTNMHRVISVCLYTLGCRTERLF